MATDVELKACPFCGGSAEMDTHQNYRNITTGAVEAQCAVYCTACGAQHAFCYRDAPGEEREDIRAMVVANWNTRPSLTQEQREQPTADIANEIERIAYGVQPPTEASRRLFEIAIAVRNIRPPPPPRQSPMTDETMEQRVERLTLAMASTDWSDTTVIFSLKPTTYGDLRAILTSLRNKEAECERLKERHRQTELDACRQAERASSEKARAEALRASLDRLVEASGPFVAVAAGYSLDMPAFNYDAPLQTRKLTYNHFRALQAAHVGARPDA